MSRLRTAKQARSLNRSHLLRMRQLIKLSPCIALASQVLMLAKDPNLATDSLRSALIVASNANNADTRSPTVRNRELHLGARRVKHTNKRDKGQPILEARVIRRAIRLVMRHVLVRLLLVRERERAEPLTTVRGRLLHDALAESSREGDRLAVDDGVSATVEHRFGRALDVQAEGARAVDEDRHHLAVARELEGHEARDGSFVVGADGRCTRGGREFLEGSDILVESSELLRQDTKGSLSRLTHTTVVVLALEKLKVR